ncbi:TRAP transporter substrate-binding protein [Kushneria aurantia]|uniref:TRAP transporter substrate-binding protein n=1 Tax=Kushneria aurantia TaxID=504092 RepID=A0ABV6G7E6_9GAMM|nr:TRAP transporter substrate-binding protein [Kushneria aurantia]
MPRLNRLFCFLISGLLLSLSGTSQAQTHWIMATGYPQDNFFTHNIEMFIKEIEEKSDGELTIDLRPNGTLINHDAIKRAVQSGQVQIGEIRLGVYGNEDPMYRLDSLPGAATTLEQARQLLEAQASYLEKLLSEDSIIPLAYVPWPGQGFFTSVPLKSVTDMQGMKIRIYSQPTRQMAEQLGFQATILPFAEIAQAYSTGMINSLFTSAQTGIDIQVWDYAHYFTYTGTSHSKNTIIVNQRAFHALGDELQRIVLEAGKNATERGWEMSRQAAASNQETLVENGMQIDQASNDIQQAIGQIGDDLLTQWRESASPEARDVLDRYLQMRSGKQD